MTDTTGTAARRLADQLEPDEFATWFKPLRVRSEDPERLVLLAPDSGFVHTLEESYRPAVDRAIAGLTGPRFEVLFSVDSTAATTERTHPARGRAAPSEQGLRPEYTFDTFVVGKSNEFAHAAAQAVARARRTATTRSSSTAASAWARPTCSTPSATTSPGQPASLRVMYLAAEQFVNELINSIRFDRMPAFRERYRTIDVLLVDDIQFLANKERTQEEFFHTFNTLYTSQKQIILSSDSSPRQIPTLEERLRSRFEWGLITDIQPPDLETKVAILRRKAEIEGIELPQGVAYFIARQVRSNIRELEGLLNRVVAFASLTGKPLSLELAKETLKDILPQADHRDSAAEIIKLVARHYGLKVSEIKSRNNSKQIAFPRQVAMYLCKKLTDLSYPEIGKQFNNKHHSTVMYAVDKIEQLRETDDDLDRTLRTIQEHFS